MNLLILIALVPAVLADTHLRLFHRIYDPLHPTAQYSLRGTVLLSDSAVSFSPDPRDSLRFPENGHGLDGFLYQVALERDSDPDEGHWDFSTVKACHLASHTEDKLILHLTTQGKPFAIDYFLRPVPHDGSCPTDLDRPSAAPFANTTLVLRSHGVPQQPALRSPPPLTPEGNIVQPIPEKSFFQKYWMYFLAIGMLIVIGGAAPDEEPRRRRD